MVTAAQKAAPAKAAAKKAAEPKAPKPPKPDKFCLHGCGLKTKGGDFVIGHDAKLKSVLQKAHVAGDKTVDLGDSPLSGKAPMAIAKERGWGKYLDKAAEVAKAKADKPKRTRKVKGAPVEVGTEVEFAYRGSKHKGKVVELNGERARVEFEFEGKTETRPLGVASLTSVSAAPAV